MSWVHATGKDTTENTVWANVTRLGVYAIAEEQTSWWRTLKDGWNLISLPLTDLIVSPRP